MQPLIYLVFSIQKEILQNIKLIYYVSLYYAPPPLRITVSRLCMSDEKELYCAVVIVALSFLA